MDTSANTSFIQALTNYDRNNIPSKKPDIFYDESVMKSIELCDNNTDYKDQFRMLNITTERLKLIASQKSNKKSQTFEKQIVCDSKKRSEAA